VGHGGTEGVVGDTKDELGSCVLLGAERGWETTDSYKRDRSSTRLLNDALANQKTRVAVLCWAQSMLGERALGRS
jgi:hypothetical protein